MSTAPDRKPTTIFRVKPRGRGVTRQALGARDQGAIENGQGVVIRCEEEDVDTNPEARGGRHYDMVANHKNDRYGAQAVERGIVAHGFLSRAALRKRASASLEAPAAISYVSF
jgi:hypothetical protein